MNSFSERMAEAKAVKANREYKGQVTTVHASWKAKRKTLPMNSWDSLTYQVRKDWRSDVGKFLNEFQQHCLNNDDPDTWEF